MIFPKHIAFIMDGNRRWSKEHSLTLESGYRKGADVLSEIIRYFIEKKYSVTLSFFAFSKENWGRPSYEVDLLFTLFNESLYEILRKFNPLSLRISFIGDKEPLPEKTKKILLELEKKYSQKAPLHIVIALNYSGQWDIDQAVVKFAHKEKDKVHWQHYLQAHSFPPPDILIRTGKRQRISNYFLYQLAYTELYFPRVYWPDFTFLHLENILKSFSKRKRFFGVGEYIETA